MILNIVFVIAIYLLSVNADGHKISYRAVYQMDQNNIEDFEHKTQNYYSNVMLKKLHQEENCMNHSFKKAFKRTWISKCQPMDTVVLLTSQFYDYTQPHAVIVKRCMESGCLGVNSCAPTKTQDISVAVKLFKKNSITHCGYINIKEHTKCNCQCLVKPEHCTALQKYMPHNCSCECMNRDMKIRCLSEGMLWNEKTCSCSCHSNLMECSTGLVWVPEYCRCVKIMMGQNKQNNLMF